MPKWTAGADRVGMDQDDSGRAPIWAASWDRSRIDRNDDWYGVAAVTPQSLIIVQPKQTDKTSRSQQLTAHRLVNSDMPEADPAIALSAVKDVIRSAIKPLVIERSSIVSIDALAKGNLLRIRTTNNVHVVGNFEYKQDVTRVAKDLAAILVPDAHAHTVARPALTVGLLRHLAVAPATVAGFFAIALAVRLLIGDNPSGQVMTRPRHRGIEAVISAIPAPLLAAAGLIVVAALIVRITFRARDEVRWVSAPAPTQDSPAGEASNAAMVIPHAAGEAPNTVVVF